ncbi:MAG: restriction endonuclease subunit S [Candidatus Cloacimonetes bacterium]|nr:restriction endonuclease subunit S [Candidatus Cloacimonadota bacterium]
MNRKMKDSGIEWIGVVPEGWRIERLKNFGWTRTGISSLKQDDFGHGFPFLNYKNVYKNFEVDYNAIELVDCTELEREKYSIKKGDIFFTGSSETIEELGLSSVALKDWENAVFNGFTIRFRPTNKELDTNYSKYLFRSEVCRGYLAANDNSITRANLSQQRLLCMSIVIPPLSEQTAIANFLEDKCSKIDSLIELQHKMIDELKEYKKGIIQKVTTKGINNTEFKESGIEWIGEVPDEWVVKKLSMLIKLRQETGNFSTCFNFLGLENIESWSGKYVETENDYSEKQSDRYYKGDLLFSKLRPYLAKIYLAKEDGFCTGEFLVIKNFVGNLKYLFYVLLSQNFIDIVNSSTYGTKMPRASWNFIKNLNIPYPPLPEQITIASYLDEKCSNIDKIIDLKHQKIAELKDYKKSLIYEYVTGKREV